MADSKYFLGLDIGTNSVGWAVTDDRYKLKKFKGNLMWGVHLFDEAKQAAERRSFRTARRRLERRKQRIALLQEFFAPEIIKKDKYFFFRLKESGLLPDDSEHRSHNIYFDDIDYTDKDYYIDYPTIHHLMCELMSSRKPHDVRLVYLACAYLLGHRGHFLSEVDKDNIDRIKDFAPIYDEFIYSLENVTDNIPFDVNNNELSELIKQRLSVTAKEKRLTELLFNGKKPKPDLSSDIRYDCLIKLMSGGKVKLSDLFLNDEFAALESNSISVASADFLDTLDSLNGSVSDDQWALLHAVKEMNDWSVLVNNLKKSTSISESKVTEYETHRKDLEELKFFVRGYLSKKEYNDIFREISSKANYVSYIYNAPSDNERSKYKKCSQEDFCKFLKPYLEKIEPSDEDKERYDELYTTCISNELCPKQVTTDNRVIPYQLYYYELKKILENASGYLLFLNEKDEYGTVADKILSFMEFKIPYYVGPLVGSSKSDNAWMERKAEGKIYPWNFDDIVDHEKSEEAFIRRMTCKCTYLAGEEELPKYSLLYCKFTVLNEINNLAVDGKKISVQAKQTVFNELFMKKRRVTVKDIKGCLISLGEMAEGQTLGGIDTTVKSSLKSYHDFKTLLSSGVLTESDVESIIERITVTTDTKRLKNWLKSEFPGLSEDNLKYISTRGYKDYGRLSRELLEEVFETDTKTGEVMSDNIITRLWETNENLMQLLGSKYKYMESIEALNRLYYSNPKNGRTLPERLKDMYISPAVQRSITRTVDIVKEIKGIIGKDPDKIFIEMARENDETKKGKRTRSRREQITEHLKNARHISGEYNIQELEQQLGKDDDGRLRSEKVFLYFMQLGKCMYSGRAIGFDKLGSDTYNIDHIYPQARIKDDSLDNKVLVESEINGEKGDKYPINSEIRNNMHGFWAALRNKDLISEKKYQRLTRSTPFSDDELAGFIARQLVETRQSTKAAAEILKELCPDSELVYVKAGLASDMRHDLGMLKCREINDLHHAKDAYLNIVAGNVYNVKFTKDPLNFIKSGETYQLSLFNKSTDEKSKGLLTRKVERNGEMAWDPSSSFETVRQMMSKNSVRYVRYTFKRKGGLFNQMPERKSAGLVERKAGLDTAKYGGYNNTTAACFAIVKYDTSVVFIPIDTMYLQRFIADSDFAKTYAVKQLNEILSVDANEDNIVFPYRDRLIKINTMIEYNGFRANIVQKSNKGRTWVLASALPLILDKDKHEYFRQICSFVSKRKDDKSRIADTYGSFSKEMNETIYDVLSDKLSSAPFRTISIFAKLGDKIKKSKTTFCSLSMTDQALALFGIMSLMKTGRSTGCDLKLISESGQAGVITMNSCITKISGVKSVYIIDQSPTGLFEKKSVNLLKL